MGELILLDNQRPHLAGTGYCIQCKHEWAAVAPVGTTCLECPSCGSFKGIMKGLTEPEGLVFACNCGNNLFFLTPNNYPMCCNCGSRVDPN